MATGTPFPPEGSAGRGLFRLHQCLSTSGSVVAVGLLAGFPGGGPHQQRGHRASLRFPQTRPGECVR